MMWPLFAKLLGAGCVTMCGVVWGMARARGISLRVKMVEEMLRFLQCVESELDFRAQETPLLLHSAQRKARLHTLPLSFEGLRAGPEFPQQLAQRMAVLGSDRLMQGVPSTALEAFSTALCRLGTVAAGEECRELRYAQAQLHRLCEESRRDAQNRQKLSIVLGAGAGACIALLLI